jgi:ubiquinone/menaquinone biosynthesis C-methylase UbiE
MKLSEQNRIKSKIISIDPNRWWGDNFDVRFYLISQIKKISKKYVLDLGGGIGIISSEIDENNYRINLDSSFTDLKTCKNQLGSKINNICASMTHIPIKESVIDHVICCNLLEVAKKYDLDNKLNKNNQYPTLDKTLKEMKKIIKKDGSIFITTPNNNYYQTNKLTFSELDSAINKIFSNVKIYYYNTYRKLKENRKLNLANVIPKCLSKIQGVDVTINNLLKENSRNEYSVSFFVKINIIKD